MRLLEIVNAVKNTPRLGWVQRGVPSSIAETIAEHIIETSVICLDLGDLFLREYIFSEKEIKESILIALIHDLPEGVVGDLNRYVSKRIGDLKKVLEKTVIDDMNNKLIKDLFEEYINMSSVKSLLAKLCDRIATYTQALRYDRLGYNTSDIIENTKAEIKNLVESICLSRERCREIINEYIQRIESTV